MFVVVAYDIAEDKRRTKVMKCLKNFGEHVQFSVFECELSDAAYTQLRTRLDALVAPKEDNIRFYFFDEDAIKRIEKIGDLVREVARAQEVYFLGD